MATIYVLVKTLFALTGLFGSTSTLYFNVDSSRTQVDEQFVYLRAAQKHQVDNCVKWIPEMLRSGWPVERLTTLDNIMWAESRCQPDVHGTGAYGLLQIQYNAHKHWLKTEFGITDRTELYDPHTNLRAALWLAEYAEEHYGCWAQPWYMSGDWC